MAEHPPAADPPFLTIAIPTYNRAAVLERTLRIIVPQLDAFARLVIIDNASTDGTPDVCERFLGTGAPLEVIRNPLNIGADANIVRCCEHAGPGHLWILSDDDLPHADAVATIRAVIRRHPAADYINFHTTVLDILGVARRDERVASGPEAFVESLDSFGNLLFLTAGVYRSGLVTAGIIDGHDAIHTCGPSIAIVLRAIGRGGASVVFTPASIAAWGDPPTWDVARVARGVYGLVSLLPAGRLRRRFAAKVFAIFPPHLWRRNALHGLVADLTGEEGDLAAALDRYRFAAGMQARFIPGLVLAGCLRMAAPFGVRSLARWLHGAVRAGRAGRAASRPADASPR